MPPAWKPPAWKPPKPKRSMKSAAGPSPPVNIAFEHIHVEGQPVALELRCLQHHDGIADFRSVRAEHRDGGVRRILGKALFAGIAWRPFLQQVGRERMPCRPHRAVRENDRVGRHAGECEFAALQAGAAGVHDDQRRHNLRLGLADRLLQRLVLGVEGVVWASAGAAPQSRRAMIMQLVRFFLAMRNSLP